MRAVADVQTPGQVGTKDRVLTESLCAPIIGHDKAFCNLRAAFALKGTTLSRTDRADGVVSFYATRWGFVRHLGNFDEARDFLRLIGGAA